jgi:hypothetical protein
VKVRALEVLGPGFRTVMLAVPCVATSVAGIAAVSWALLTKVVVRLDPFHLTVELETKLEPLTVKAKAGPPAFAELGLILLKTGATAERTRVKALVAVWGVG